MNLLIISNNPDRPSFRQRIGIYVDTLCSAGINCEAAKLPTNRVKRFKLFKQAANFDAVFLHKKCLNVFDISCLRFYSKKIVYDFDDAIMYSPNNPASNKTSHFRLFRRTAKLADMIIAGNSYLAEHARRFNNNIKILPTGLNISTYQVQENARRDDRIRFVWIGSKSTLRYLAELKPALEQIGKRYSNIVLRIICDEFFDLQNMEVEKCRWSLENQAIDLATGDIGLAPLPDNRFTRGKCGFKALQYAAAGLPTIASPVGVHLLYVWDNITGFLANEPEEWIDRIIELLQNPELRKRMGKEGRAYAENFDVSVIGKQLVELITKCLQGPILSRQ